MDALGRALSLSLVDPANGEAQIRELLQSPDAAYGLAQIFLAPAADLPLRQAAGLALRRYIPTNWRPEPATTAEPSHKAEIRLQLLHGLADPTRKIRLACAACVSEIASIDFHSDDWPELIDALIALIDDGRPECVDGGVRVLAEFVKADLAEDQLLPMTERMLPQLYQIVCSPQRHAAPSRARALAVLRQSVFTLHMVKDTFAAAVQKAVGDILPTWNEAIVGLLSSDLGDGEDLPVRIEAVRALETVLSSFPKTLGSHLAQIITAIVQQLPKLREWLFSPDGAPALPLTDEGSDISAEPSRLAALFLDVTLRIAKKPVAQPLFVGAEGQTGALAPVLNETIACAHITAEDEERWEESPDEWIADDDDEFSTVYGVRAAAHDLVAGLVDLLPQQALPTLWSAVEYAIGKGETAKANGAEDWWKHAEAALTLTASVADDITTESAQIAFDVRRLLELAVLPHLMPNSPPFLQARAFVVSSRFASSLPSDTAKQCVHHALDTLERADAAVLVKLAAVKSFKNFTTSLPADLVRPFCLRAIASCGILLGHATDNQQTLLIETIESAIRTAPSSLAASDATTVFSAVLDRWAANAQDPILSSAVSDLCSTYAGSQEPAVLQCLLDTILPRLAQAIADVQRDHDSPVAVPAVAILDSILLERSAPLGQGVFATFASALFDALELHDDQAMLQDGISALTQVVRKDCEQLLSWSSGGRSGLDRLLGVLAKTLAPSQSESGGLFVGDLILHLIRSAGNAILPVLPDLLNALVVRLSTAQTATFAQSLILPFAYLIHGQRDTVLDLLEKLDVSGRPGVEVLATSWADNLETFSGFWNTRISTVALTDLLLSRRPSLEHLTVKGEIVITAQRSNVPEQWTTISFPAKVLKTLAGELSTLRKEATAAEREAALSDDGDAEWEDGDDDEDEDGFDEKHEDLAFLSGLSGGKDLLEDRVIERQEDDDDLKNDPIHQLDLAGYITGALRQAVADDGARIGSLAESLTPSERLVLQRALE